LLVVSLAVLATGVAAAPASADVLVSDPGTHASGCVKVGVWYQSFSGGPRNAEIRILSKHKRTRFDRHVKAVASHWKYWSFCPDTSGRYLVRYYTPGGKYQRWVLITV
jgi:hypothetical protein